MSASPRTLRANPSRANLERELDCLAEAGGGAVGEADLAEA
jgi:hypothetical protein